MRRVMQMMGATAPGVPVDTSGSGDAVEEVVTVNKDIVGFIIGRGGENIRHLQDSNGVNVQIQKDFEAGPGVSTRDITVKGAKPGVERAVAMIKEMLEERERERAEYRNRSSGGGASRYGPDGASDEIVIPNERTGLVIGRGGSTIMGIQDRTGAHVQVPKEANPDNPYMRTLQIEGPNKASVEAAKKEIEMLMAGDARGVSERGTACGGCMNEHAL